MNDYLTHGYGAPVRRRCLLGLLAWAVALYAPLASAQLFSRSTPGNWNYTVPAGVNAVQVSIAGAGGGAGGPSNCAEPGNGGTGARTTAVIAVALGDVLSGRIGAGGGGGNGAIPNVGGGAGGSGIGAGGGGGASSASAPPAGGNGSGGGGGGGTTLLLNGTVLQVGGGGGGGGASGGTNAGACHGNTGQTASAVITNIVSCPLTGNGTSGGTGNNGGLGGGGGGGGGGGRVGGGGGGGGSENAGGGSGRAGTSCYTTGANAFVSAPTIASTGGAGGVGRNQPGGAGSVLITIPVLTKAFAPTAIVTGATTTLTFTITNTTGNPAWTGLGFTDTLPSGLVLASVPTAAQCGGVVTGTAGGTVIAFSGGTLASGASTCAVAVQVTSAASPTLGACPQAANTNGSANLSGLSNLANGVTNQCLTVRTTVSGRVFEDTAGELLADGAIGSSANPGINGATVRLFNSAGTQQSTTTTSTVGGIAGTYSFNTLVGGTFYVTVDRPGTTASGTVGVLGEQTYASAGSGNAGAAGGAGYGPLCVVGTPPTYTDNSATVTTGTAANPANGACYGGRRGGTVDNPGVAVNNNEHVIRLVVGTSAITNTDFGFSFNVVTLTADSGQGSLRQFIGNANAIPGANTMRFVPAVATNQPTWWRVAPTTNLPVISGANAISTIVDGTAYSRVDGVTVLDTATGNLEAGATVGVNGDQMTIAAIPRPELEVKGSTAAGTATTAAVFEVGASSGVQLQHLSITSGTEAVQVRSSGVSGLLVQWNAIGWQPNGTAARPVSLGGGIALNLGSTAVNACSGINGLVAQIRNNAITATGNAMIGCNITGLSLGNLVVAENVFRNNTAASMLVPGGGPAGVSSATRNVQILHNLVSGSAGNGIIMAENATGSGHQVIGNTITASGGRGILFTTLAAGAYAGPALVRGNDISANANEGVGIASVSTTTMQQIRISQNGFSGNGGNAIDLGLNGVSTGAGCSAFAGGLMNGNLGRPTIHYAVLGGGTLTVSASYCGTGTYTLEFYKVASGAATGDVGADGKQAGEGQAYLGALSGLGGGTLNVGALAVTGLATGDRITAIAIREDGAGTAGNTSEFSAVSALNPTLLLRKTTLGGTGSTSFTVSNADTDLTTPAVADSAAGITTTVAGTAVGFDANAALAGVQAIVVAQSGQQVNVVETVPAGYSLTAASCTDGTSTFTATGLPAIGGSTGTVTIPAANVVAGSNWTCDFVNTVVARLTIRKTSLGGTGSFAFTGTNGLPAVLPGVTVTTTAAGASADSAVQTLAANGVATTVIEQIPPGWTLNTVSCFDRNAAATGNPASFGTVSANAITVPAANVVTGADIVCAFTDTYGGFTVSGRVFRDSGAPIPLGTGANSGTPNDGVQNGSEAGIAGVTVSLTDCGATTYATTSTDASGDYSLGSGGAVGGGCVEEHNPTGTVSTGANQSGTPLSAPTYDRNLDRVQLTLVSGTSVAGVNFGDVSTNQLLTDGMNAGVPGSQVVYPHTFIAGTGGTVGFTTSAVPVPVQGWSQVMYLDANCNAVLDGDPVLSGPITVVEGQTVCLLLVEQVPAGAANGSMDDATLTASFTFANAGPALGGTYTRHDVTTVSDTALGLTKRVRNVTQGTPFATSNQARTGDVLEYEVTFRNNGPEAIGTLVVHDATPAYTQFVSATCGAPLPAALTGCSVTQQPAVGAAGAIDWTYAGMLVPGQSGSVTYRITVQ